jgi:exodeoxyribonuclease V gamma subunit
MVRLVYSNDTGELLAELAQRVRAQQLRDGPLTPIRIVVPTLSVDAYVRFGIARACGVAANLDVTPLTSFASNLLADASGVHVADAAAFEAMALETFFDEAALAAADLAPVKAYLYACGDAAEAVDLRRVQLAAHVGRLFEVYTHSRAEMLMAWSDGAMLEGGGGETERWQRALWREMFGPRALAGARAGRRAVGALHDLASSFDPAAVHLPSALHVFALPSLPRTFQALFERLARHSEVVTYVLSPCEGFWEDFDARDPGPLLLWGRPGREHVRALNVLAGFDHEDRFVDPLDRSKGAPTLLKRLQSDILRRVRSDAVADSKRSLRADDSLVLLEHANVRRELEVVASDIWRLIADDETLRFDDVAILVPDNDLVAYASQLPTVFREAHELPYRIVGAPGSGGVVEAIELLLALPYGRFSRQELLRVASHPLIAPPEADPDRWAAWCEGLGIVHGADRTDHEGTYVARDILSWDQGLRRLALGSFMAGDISDSREPFEVEGQSYVPLEVAPSELREAAAFGLLLRSMVEDGRYARGAELSLRDWSGLLRAFVESYITPKSQADEEELARALRCLHDLVEVDRVGRPVRYRVAVELARERLHAVRGATHGEGVALSTLTGLRPLPFRVVFACGLGEGRFPSSEADDPLDLGSAHRREADVTPREKDRYAFLELLTTPTLDRLALSYVSRDTVTGQRLSPSSVVQELLHSLSLGYVDDVDVLRRRHPLRRWDPAYFPDLFPGRREAGLRLEALRLPEARAEARTLALRLSLERHGERAAPEDVLERAEGNAAWTELARHLLLAPLPTAPVDAQQRVFVPLYAIVKFLEFPLQAWARFSLGLDEREEEDAAAREHELFETDFRDETLFLRRVLLGARTGKTLHQAYDEAARERELRGSGPSGVFARAERSDHLRVLRIWGAELAARGIAMEGVEVHRFGRGGEASQADCVHEALVLDADYTDRNGVTRVVKVELAGGTLPLAVDRTVSITLAKRAAPKDVWGRVDRAQLRAFVDHAVLSATGVVPSSPHDSLSILATPEGPTRDHVSFEPLTRDEACGWLREMVRDLLSGPHAYFLPCEAVLVHEAASADGPLSERLAEAQNKMHESDGPLALRSAYGPVPHPDEYPLPEDESAREMVARRFGLLFAKRRSSR